MSWVALLFYGSASYLDNQQVRNPNSVSRATGSQSSVYLSASEAKTARPF
jgi:hypothetical protein